MSVTEIRNATIVDPLHPLDGETTSLFFQDDVLIATPTSKDVVSRSIDLKGALVLAGGIDLHTHIGGGKVNLARMLTSDFAESDKTVWPCIQNGHKYIQMGYTTCFEPAMQLTSARHTHYELADTPHLDSGAYVVMGNDAWLLEALSRGVEAEVLDQFLAWTVAASQAQAIKVVNAGGISAFKFHQRKLDVDEEHCHYRITPRNIIRDLSASIARLQLPHPLHVHASNLGVPGNIRATLSTLDAAEGAPIHLTHAQFNCYSDVGDYGMGSGAEELAKYVNEHRNVSLDVGQVIFGQTVTISADLAAQFRNRPNAKPKRYNLAGVECQSGCGVVPFKYADNQYVHSLQWTIGLELLLLVDDPWRVFLTTDHPNGGPFTSYPHLIRLLMDRTYRLEMLERLHPKVQASTLLQELNREYSLQEIAILTRAAPAKILGLHDRGCLLPGRQASLAAYRKQADWETTFRTAELVLKSGTLVVESGKVQDVVSDTQGISASIPFDSSAIESIHQDLEESLGVSSRSLEISQTEMQNAIRN